MTYFSLFMFFRKKCFLFAIFTLFWTSICNWSGTKEFSRVGKPGARRRRKFQKKVLLECHFCIILDPNLQLVWNQGINPRNLEPAACENFRKKCLLSAIFALFCTSICNWSGAKEFSRVGECPPPSPLEFSRVGESISRGGGCAVELCP